MVAKWLGKAGWLVVIGSALTLSAWSLYYVGRHYGVPPILALIISISFDGAGLVCADNALRYATHGDEGIGPRLMMLGLTGTSAYLNQEHAVLAHDPFGARILFACPPITGLVIYELHNRWVRRAALKRAGNRPVLSRMTWLLFPINSFKALRTVYRREIDDTVNNVVEAELVDNESSPLAIETSPAAMRQWARDQGYDVPPRGRISKDIQALYLQALTEVEQLPLAVGE